MKTRLSLVGLACAALALTACQTIKSWFGGSKQTAADAKPRPLRIHSFSDTLSVTALAAGDSALFVGTPRGLLKWDLAGRGSTLLDQKAGLPGDKVSAIAGDGTGGIWVLTSGGLAHQNKAGVWSNSPAVPVGDFVTGLVQSSDGALWAGGPEGLARLKGTAWERYLGSASVTAIATVGEEAWVGTSGRGVVRIAEGKAIVYGADQGCETDVVRGLVPTQNGVLAIGEGPGGPRVAVWDGRRFWSYRVEGTHKGQVLEWVRRVGSDTLVGSGSDVFAIRSGAAEAAAAQPFKIVLATPKARKAPPSGPATGEIPDKAAAPAPAAAAPPAGGPTVLDEVGSKDAKDTKAAKTGKTGKSKEKAPPPPPPKPAIVLADEPAPREADAPAFWVAKWGPTLPEGVTAVAPDGPALYVGTRFLGASRISAGDEIVAFRTADLAQSAVKLSVACEGKDCYVATGGPRAWHFDGQSFDPTDIDPEPGARVLAVINTPAGGVLAIHRGKDPVLRMSSVAGGNWTPVGVTEVHVPEGSPEITFAKYAPNRHLWLGLHYIDKVGDRVDYGAAEVDVDAGKVTYHRRFSADSKAENRGISLPNDIESAHFRSDDETWFGTHTGAARLKGKEVRVYTENDGLESEYIRDILEGPDGQIWVATSKGVGRFDGTRWVFPQPGDVLRVKATSLAKDRRGWMFIGTNEGIVIKAPPPAITVEKIDVAKGLLENRVLNLDTDPAGRVWALTEKGLSVVER